MLTLKGELKSTSTISEKIIVALTGTNPIAKKHSIILLHNLLLENNYAQLEGNFCEETDSFSSLLFKNGKSIFLSNNTYSISALENELYYSSQSYNMAFAICTDSETQVAEKLIQHNLNREQPIIINKSLGNLYNYAYCDEQEDQANEMFSFVEDMLYS